MTVTSSSLPFLFAASVVFVVVFGSVVLWKRRVPGLTGTLALQAAIYLQRYALALEYYGLRAREIRAQVDEVRADLVASDPAEADALLERLGPPRTLAAGVAGHLLRPSWLRGTIWLGVASAAMLGIAVLVTEAFLGGFEPLANPGDYVSWTGPGLEVDATMGSDGRVSSVGFGGVALLVVPLIAFACGARAWRIRPR